MSVYEIVTERIIAKLEAGVVPWRRPWGTTEYRPPRNVRGSEYRGINVFLLACQAYRSEFWLTFNQARELGGSVRKGERSTVVVFWKWNEKETPDSESGELRAVSLPILRYYNVFNVEQIEGLPEKFYGEPTSVQREFEPLEACARVVAGYSEAPEIRHVGNRAFYAPSSDTVTVPTREAFPSSDTYYATLFHELGHSTGHATRLGREGITDQILFGSHVYSREELVAEMTSAFLCATAGIDSEALLENSVAYLASWIRVLKGSPKLAIVAAAQAQRAADWIRGCREQDVERSAAAA